MASARDAAASDPLLAEPEPEPEPECGGVAPEPAVGEPLGPLDTEIVAIVSGDGDT